MVAGFAVRNESDNEFSALFINIESYLKSIINGLIPSKVHYKHNIDDSVKTELLKNGFTIDGLSSLIEKSNLLNENIIDTALIIINLLNKQVNEGGIVSYRLLNKYINDVNPELTNVAKDLLREVIMEGTTYGRDLEKDYYSAIPEGLIAEMRKWNTL